MTRTPHINLRDFLRMVWPASVNQLSVIVMGLVSTAIVGRLGPRELSSVALVNVWLPVLAALSFGPVGAVQMIVATRVGEGRGKESGAAAWQGIHFGLASGVVLAAALLATGHPLSSWLVKRSDTVTFVWEYLQIRLLAIPLFSVGMAIRSFFRGLRDMKTPLTATVVAQVAHAVASFALAFGMFGLPAWGVRGAALGMVIGTAVETALLFLAFLRPVQREKHNTHVPKVDVPLLKQVLEIGWPMGPTAAFTSSGQGVLYAMVVPLGSRALAANHVLVAFHSLASSVLGGVSAAAITEISVAKATKIPGSTRAVTKLAVRVGVAISIAMALLFALGQRFWIRGLTSDAEVLELASSSAPIAAATAAGFGLALSTTGILNGLGETKATFVIFATAMWLVYLPLVHVFVNMLSMGLRGVFMAGFLQIAYVSGLQALVLSKRLSAKAPSAGG